MRRLIVLGLLAAPVPLGLAQDKAGPKDNMPPPGFTALFRAYPRT